MANPALNDKTFAPERLRTFDPRGTSGAAGTEVWRDRMTLDGVVLRCLILFPILLATAGSDGSRWSAPPPARRCRAGSCLRCWPAWPSRS